MEQKAVIAKGGAAFSADAGAGQAKCRLLHKLRFAGNISAGGSKAAAGVFDERAGNKVRTYFGRLNDVCKLTLAVIYHDAGMWVYLTDNGTYAAYLLNGESLALTIAPGALNKNSCNLHICSSVADAVVIGLALSVEINLGIINTVKLQ